jgi:hypothetical protein
VLRDETGTASVISWWFGGLRCIARKNLHKDVFIDGDWAKLTRNWITVEKAPELDDETVELDECENI